MEILDTDNFDTKIAKGKVLVDFYADWCGPCKMLTPVLEEIDQELKDVSIYKVNVDNNQELASEFGVQSIPNLIVFQDGKAVDQMVGFTPKEEIIKHLQK